MQKKYISAERVLHRQQRRICLRFHKDAVMQRFIQQVAGARWSSSRKCWHIPDDKSLFSDLKSRLPEGWEMLPEGVTLPALMPEPVAEATRKLPEKPVPEDVFKAPSIPMKPLIEENSREMQRMIEKLQLKGYSPSTIRTYRNEFLLFISILGNHRVAELQTERVKQYILYCIGTLKLSENTIHSRVNALKFYYEQVLGRERFFVDIPRPKKQMILPKVLGEHEVARLFKALENKKHKALLFTAYSAGLRVSEIVHLRICDIDSSRMQIFVERAKGKKDRVVMLSPLVLDVLRKYIQDANPRPVEYLFEGMEPGKPLSTRTAQAIFNHARKKAGIRKEVSFHSLRHSFATHLLEQGVNVKYIQELLGHFSILTTNRYLHVRREELVNVQSPVDRIFNGLSIL